MPVQPQQWTEFLTCPICYNDFEGNIRRPVSLSCGHTVCRSCLSKIQRKRCPFDHTIINADISLLPDNYALSQLVGGVIPKDDEVNTPLVPKEDMQYYLEARKAIEELALYLKTTVPKVNNKNSALSRPMQRKLVTLLNCQLVEDEGKTRAMRAARSLGERSVSELLLHHQNSQLLAANLWAAVRARCCQFLGPPIQEEFLKLVLLALEDGSVLSRKALVMFVVQRLSSNFPQASKTSIGHVVQLLYRASCFKVSKQDGDSSLMQLKEEFRTYEALRREHDAQIVQIATDAGLRIVPEQWSTLLYGDATHKSHMQSIIDKLQTPQSFAQSVQELVIALQRSHDPGNLFTLRTPLEVLANIDANPDASIPSWKDLRNAQEAAKIVVKGMVEFVQNFGNRKPGDERQNPDGMFKGSVCRDLIIQGCSHGIGCTFPHAADELETYRLKSKRVTVFRGVCARNPCSTFESSDLLGSESSQTGISPTSGQLSGKSHISTILQRPNTEGLQQCGTTIATSAPTFTPLKISQPLNPNTPPFQPMNMPPSSCPQERKIDLFSIPEKSQKFQTFHSTSGRSVNELSGSDNVTNQRRNLEIGKKAYYSPLTSASIFSDARSLASSSCSVSAPPGTRFSEDQKYKLYSGLFSPSEKDEFIPFNPPLISKYGPISRFSKDLLHGSNTMHGNSLYRFGDLSTNVDPFVSTDHNRYYPINPSGKPKGQFSKESLDSSRLPVSSLQEELRAIEKTLLERKYAESSVRCTAKSDEPIRPPSGPWRTGTIDKDLACGRAPEGVSGVKQQWSSLLRSDDAGPRWMVETGTNPKTSACKLGTPDGGHVMGIKKPVSKHSQSK